MNTHVFHLKQNLTTRGQTGVGEVLDDFVLGIDGDSFSSRQILKIDAMAVSLEAQLDSVVDHAFAFQSVADSGFDEEVDRALLQNAGADTFLNIATTAIFNHHGFDSLQMQEMGKHQAGRSGAHDSDLGA